MIVAEGLISTLMSLATWLRAFSYSLEDVPLQGLGFEAHVRDLQCGNIEGFTTSSSAVSSATASGLTLALTIASLNCSMALDVVHPVRLVYPDAALVLRDVRNKLPGNSPRYWMDLALCLLCRYIPGSHPWAHLSHTNSDRPPCLAAAQEAAALPGRCTAWPLHWTAAGAVPRELAR